MGELTNSEKIQIMDLAVGTCKNSTDEPIQFYKKMGLKEVGRGRERVEETRVDIVILEKIFH